MTVAQSGYPPSPSPLQASPFVEALVPNPASPPRTLLLKGYPGPSHIPHHERLYLTLDLSSYVDIPEAAILHRVYIQSNDDPFGTVYWWVTPNTTLPTVFQANHVEAAFRSKHPNTPCIP